MSERQDELPLNGIHHVEFWVGNAKQAEYYYRNAFGFSRIAYAGPETGVRDRASYVLQQGKVRFVLTTPVSPEGPMAEHIRRHGDGVRDIAFSVDDAESSFQTATSRGGPGVEEPIPYTITRDIIKIESVPYGFMIDDIGYIRVQNFARTTKDELKEKLDHLTTRNMRGLILDLRFNPGGLLMAAQEVSELFLERDKLIVFTKGRLREQNHSYYSEARGRVYNQVPMIVMINGSSASASEIVSAAIQDHDAGLVVGKTSFGKGSVQTVFRLDEDEALKLTTARYYTPSGRSIHKERPRHPDMGDMTAAMMDGAEAPSLDQDPAEKEVERFDKEKFYTDSGRVVYGGGGITPDIEIDQDFLSDFEVAVERDGALFSFAVEYASNHDGINEDWQVSDGTFAAFKDFLQKREKIEEYLGVFELSYSDSLVDANSDFLKRGIRREMARRQAGPEAAYRVAIEADTQLHEALELFRQARTLEELLAVAEEWNAEQMRQLAAEDLKHEEAAVKN